jgi:hypothetical protein
LPKKSVPMEVPNLKPLACAIYLCPHWKSPKEMSVPNSLHLFIGKEKGKNDGQSKDDSM